MTARQVGWDNGGVIPEDRRKQALRRRSRQRRATVVVVGVLAAFLIAVLGVIVLGRDRNTQEVAPIAVTTTVPPVTTTTLGVTQYTVQPGDTLLAIAERFGVSELEIMEANELPNRDVLTAGQVLDIPPPRIPVLVVKPSTIRVGEGIEIVLTGAQAFEQVTFAITSPVSTFTGQAHTAPKDGKLVTSYDLEPTDVPGTYTVTATGDILTNVSTTFVVEPAKA